MRSLALPLLLIWAAPLGAETPPVLITRPDAFKTLVNPQCSHCRDEAKRRAGELRDQDRVLCWIRGYSDGGAIPLRFFLNPYRVISDTYGVFVYDPDAGYARAFAPSLDFRFHGYRNGVMVMKHKDGTLYSCLTGLAFDGPGKGQRLAAVPTLMSDWGPWLKAYPQAVAYQMFEKYQPTELPTQVNADSRKSRPAADKRLPGETDVLGVLAGGQARAYPLDSVAKAGLVRDKLGDRDLVILWQPGTRTAVAYHPLAAPPKKDGEPRPATLQEDRSHPDAPYVDQETGSRWDITGRAVAGERKGWTLSWAESVMVRWFAWAAEMPQTSIYAPPASNNTSPKRERGEPDGQARSAEKAKEIAGTAEFLRGVPKRLARITGVDAAKREVKLIEEGQKEPSLWKLTPDAEVRIAGWWGRLEQLRPGDRVWVWYKIDRAKTPLAIFLVADEISEQDVHGPGVMLQGRSAQAVTIKPVKGGEKILKLDKTEVIRGTGKASVDQFQPGERVYFQSEGNRVQRLLDSAAFEAARQEQRRWLSKRWTEEGLPGTAIVLHLSGEMELLLDHEAMRWGRSLQPGDEVILRVGSEVKGVVKDVKPWRERTQLRLVVHGLDQALLNIGDRLLLKMKPPAEAVQNGTLPPDIDRPRSSRQERIDWFLASIYCTCKVGGDGCTGHFYTLSSCNPNACGMPNTMRRRLGEWIDQGKTDRQIFEELLKQQGHELTCPHLLP